jgi:hypothetical protein
MLFILEGADTSRVSFGNFVLDCRLA